MIMEKHRQPSTTRTPNPLAGSSSIEFPSDATTTNPADSAAAADSAASSPLRVGTTLSGVPNPILDADASNAPPTVTVNFNNTTIAPSPVVIKKAAAPAAAATSATSLVLSPLTSPSSSPQHTHSDDVMEETEARDSSCDEPPKKGQRRRSNTVHGTGNFEHRLNHQTALEEESWQPVNFGDYRDKSPRKDSVGSYASSACGSSHASHDDTYSTQQSCTPLSPPADHFGGSAPTATDKYAPSIPQNFSTNNATTTNTATSNKQQSAAGGGGGEAPTDVIIDKRQKRLERNRESARASRRRRKQYLEELENNVHSLSTEMDSGRVNHALESVKIISGLRKEKILHVLERLNAGESSTSDVDGRDINMLDTSSNNALSQAQGGNGNKNINIAKSSLGVKHNVISKTIPPPVQSSSNKQQQSSHSLLKDTNVILETSLSRTQPSFQVVNTFLHQQLKSLILTHKQPILSAASSSTTTSTTTEGGTLLGPLLPSFTPFLLWLTLQNDNFFRGGRAQSERLSAARIGERLLHRGLYRVTPSTTAAVNHNKSTTAAQQQHSNNNKGTVLWPLLCNEIGLSYDQEDKIRTAQRLVLQNVDLWIHRHTARATANVIQSVHDVIGGMTEKFERKKEAALKNEKEEEEVGESSLLTILTEEQKIKFLGWAMKNQERMKRCAERNVGKAEIEVGELEVSTDRHAAANMYIIDHRLNKIKQRVPQIGAKYVHPLKLKKLGRRPCFESLGGNEKDNDAAESTTKMSREKTFPSTGSLKRSLDEMSIDGTSSGMETNLTAITPVAAQAAGHAAASSFLKDVLPIIPKPSIQNHDHLHVQQQNQQLIHHEYNFEPEPVVSSFIAAPVMSAALPSQPQQYRHTASSSFDDIPMPTPVSVLLQTPDDLLAPVDGGVEQIMGVDPTALAAPDQFTPEAVHSSSMVSRHQSAPEFRQYINNSSAPVGMVPVPEERTNDEDDFFLDDLPMDADDWIVGDDSLQF